MSNYATDEVIIEEGLMTGNSYKFRLCMSWNYEEI